MDFIKVLIIIMDVMKQCNHFHFFHYIHKNPRVCMLLSEMKGILKKKCFFILFKFFMLPCAALSARQSKLD